MLKEINPTTVKVTNNAEGQTVEPVQVKGSKFWAHPNSILETIGTSKVSKELRARFFKNREAYFKDQRAMEMWAADGFASRLNSTTDQGSG